MPQNDVDFVKHAVLDILIPGVSDLNIEKALSSAETLKDGDDLALITTIPQRSLLFFDEKISIFVVLRTLYNDESSLKDHISRLAVALEAHAISSASITPSADGNPGAKVNQARDVIWAGKVDVSEDPIIVVEDSDDRNETQHVLLIWKMVVFLCRPRIRLQAPAIIFKLSGSLRPLRPRNQSESMDPYLPNAVPFPTNLLQSLQDDPALRGAIPKISSQRLSRAVPSVRQSRSDPFPLKAISRKAFRAIPAVSSRMRYHRCNSAAGKPAVVASLELEIPAFAQHALGLQVVDVQLNQGKADPLMKSLKLPLECQPRDNVVCLYALEPSEGSVEPSPDGSHSRSLDIFIDAIVLVSDVCHPQIEIRWKANVDFSASLNPNYNKPAQSMQRSNRPPSIPMSPASNNKSALTVPPNPTNTLGGLAAGTNSTSTNSFGLTITFTALEDVYVGEPFRWDVFIVNRTEKPRRLGITVIPKRRKGSGKGHTSRPSSSAPSSLTRAKSTAVADAVVDENMLFAVTKTQTAEPAQLICLTTDLKIGPLDPASCYSTVLVFLPLASGVLHMDAIRVVDLATNETVDVRDLPDVISSDRPLDNGEA